MDFLTDSQRSLHGVPPYSFSSRLALFHHYTKSIEREEGGHFCVVLLVTGEHVENENVQQDHGQFAISSFPFHFNHFHSFVIYFIFKYFLYFYFH